jgi:hypothetical protein
VSPGNIIREGEARGDLQRQNSGISSCTDESASWLTLSWLCLRAAEEKPKVIRRVHY